MKEMSKVKIIDKRSEKSIKSERDLLSKMNHPFLVNMHYAFQDSDTLYLVMDLLNGGDLRYHLCKYRTFTEKQTQFFMACLILGLDYCHYNNIIHRDIKPENLVLNNNGYVRITDFGIAKIQHPNNAKETSGTPGYMSPEVICSQDHTIAVDYFALGVIGYEFMMSTRPYLGKSRKEIKEKIMSKQARIKQQDIPNDWSPEAADCINKLLLRKPSQRLGYHGAREIKDHPWLKNYPWRELYDNTLKAPFIPSNSDNFDHKYCNAMEKQGIDTQERYIEILQHLNYKNVFDDYFYFSIDITANANDNMKDFVFVNPHEASFNKSHNENSSNNRPKRLANSASTNQINYIKLDSKNSNTNDNNPFYGTGTGTSTKHNYSNSLNTFKTTGHNNHYYSSQQDR